MANMDVIRAIETALDATPDNVALRKHLANLMLAEGLYSDAIAHYRTALDQTPQDAEIKFSLAKAYAGDSKCDVALVVLEDLMRTTSPGAPVLTLAARLYLQAGQEKESRQAYQRARTAPGFTPDPDLEARSSQSSDVEPPAVSSTSDPADVPVQSSQKEALPVYYVSDPNDSAQGLFEVERPRITFQDVGGMEKLKEEIRMKIIYPVSHPEMYKAYGKKAGGGILMYGPPGCGKTFLARATAGEVKANFISIGLHEVLDMYIGQSERNLHAVFEEARAQAPCVLFFDEVDALGGNRADMRHSAMRQVINQMLAEMDGVDTSNEGILILAATNTPWYVDHALRRPGRFDRVLFVPPPDQAAREAILRLLLRGKPTGTVDVTRLAREAKDFSGADLKGAVDQAIERKLADAMRRGKPYPLTTIDLSDALRGHRPTTLEWFETARNYAIYANEGGLYDEVLDYLKLPKGRKI